MIINERRLANRRLTLKLTVAVIGMFGFGYALVPLYDVICEITGLNGKTRNEAVALSAVEGGIDQNRIVTVELVTNTNAGAPWLFQAETTKLQVHPGQFYKVSYIAENLTEAELIGQAIPSVTPGSAARYFQKIECFCFIEQKFIGGESKEMPLAFRIDPALDSEIEVVTLSYTFFQRPAQGS